VSSETQQNDSVTCILLPNEQQSPSNEFLHDVFVASRSSHKTFEARVDKIFQECALVQSEATLVWNLEPIKVLSVIGQGTKEHS